jgi:hypothetical protein
MLLSCEVLGGEAASVELYSHYCGSIELPFGEDRFKWLSQDGFQQVERFPLVLWGIIPTIIVADHHAAVPQLRWTRHSSDPTGITLQPPLAFPAQQTTCRVPDADAPIGARESDPPHTLASFLRLLSIVP